MLQTDETETKFIFKAVLNTEFLFLRGLFSIYNVNPYDKYENYYKIFYIFFDRQLSLNYTTYWRLMVKAQKSSIINWQECPKPRILKIANAGLTYQWAYAVRAVRREPNVESLVKYWYQLK